MRYLRTTEVPIDSLVPFPGNARVHDEQALDESAEQNGQYRSIVARELSDGSLEVLAGHGTWGAFTRRGDQTLRVEVIEADDIEARRINLVDNGSSRQASYDDYLLLELLNAAKEEDGLTGTGWDQAALDDLVAMVGPPPSLEELEEKHGEHDEKDLWPKVVVSVPPETRDLFNRLMKHSKFEDWNDEHERFAVLLNLAEQGLDMA